MSTVSVVLEALTAHLDWSTTDLDASLRPTLDALDRQTLGDFETILVLPPGMEERTIRRDSTRVVSSPDWNYYAAKNAGARAADGEIVAFIDSDTVPNTDWLSTLVSGFQGGAAVVIGRTRYAGNSLATRVMSVVSFGVTAAGRPEPAGFVINNVAFLRAVILGHPFDERVPRHGGCYALFHRLRAEGLSITHEPAAVVEHARDATGLRVFQKQFARGTDAVTVHRLDRDLVLRGTRWRLRHPLLAPLVIGARRVALDLRELVVRRRTHRLRWLELPAAAVLMLLSRVAGVAGELTATINDRRGQR